MGRKKRVVPREVCVKRSERSNQHREVLLSTQKSAEVIIVIETKFQERRRTESVGVLSMTGKGEVTVYGRKQE